MPDKRVLVISDLHSGHQVGFSPPGYHKPQIDDPRQKKFAAVRKEVWEYVFKRLEPYRPIDILIVNGDALEGKGIRSGSTELISADRKVQCEIAKEGINHIDAPVIRMSYGCLTAGHKILTADLRYVPVENLSIGDRLLAFDDLPDPATHKRYFRESVVLANGPVLSPSCYKISLSDGTSLTATHDHKFLMKYGNSGAYVWINVEDLYRRSRYGKNKNFPKDREGKHTKYMPIKFKRFLSVWDSNPTYDAGYLAGFFDGEGSLSQRRKGRERANGAMESSFYLGATQVNNAALESTEHCLDGMGFNYSVYSKGMRGHGWKECFEIKVLGGVVEILRFLGSTRPKRLLANFDISKMGAIKNPCDDETEIVDIIPVGEQIVYALGTSTGTYISDGYLSHNTASHTGTEEDWEDIIADAVKAKIGSHEWIDVNGVIFDYKHKIGSSSIPHGRLTPLAREILWNRLWASRGLTPKADILIRSHDHYFEHCDHDGCLGFITPCLQGFGSKYGSRECSGTVDIGFIVFDITATGSIAWKKEIITGQTQTAVPEKL